LGNCRRIFFEEKKHILFHQQLLEEQELELGLNQGRHEN
jgi:hypothetical protein